MARCGRPRLSNAMAQCDSTAITTQPRWRRSRATRAVASIGRVRMSGFAGWARARDRSASFPARRAQTPDGRSTTGPRPSRGSGCHTGPRCATGRVDGEAAGIKVDRPPLRASRSRCAGVAARRESAARCRPQPGFRSPSDTAAAQTGDGWLGRSLSHRRPRAAALPANRPRKPAPTIAMRARRPPSSPANHKLP